MSALAAAETLVEIGGQAFSNLQLQKLLYIAQMMYLGENKTPMFDDDFEAWKLGPVIPNIYRRAKIYGSNPVAKLFSDLKFSEGSSQRLMLERVVKELPDKSPWKLVSITHWDKGAWASNYNQSDLGNTIPKSDILKEYYDRAERATSNRAANA